MTPSIYKVGAFRAPTIGNLDAALAPDDTACAECCEWTAAPANAWRRGVASEDGRMKTVLLISARHIPQSFRRMRPFPMLPAPVLNLKVP